MRGRKSDRTNRTFEMLIRDAAATGNVSIDCGKYSREDVMNNVLRKKKKSRLIWATRFNYLIAHISLDFFFLFIIEDSPCKIYLL